MNSQDIARIGANAAFLAFKGASDFPDDSSLKEAKRAIVGFFRLAGLNLESPGTDEERRIAGELANCMVAKHYHLIVH